MKPHRSDNTRIAYLRCACGKLCYPSVRAARHAIHEIAAYGRTMYTYRCPDSGALHLTRREQWDTRRGYVRP